MHATAFRWTFLAASIVAATAGCQRLDAEDDGNDSGDSVSNGNATTEGGGTLIGSGGDTTEGEDDEEDPSDGCDPVAQTGCGGGEKCTALISGAGLAYACVTDSGPLQPQEACQVSLDDGIDGCSAGYVCLGEEDGICRAHCASESNCPSGLCLEDANDSVLHCADECSPFEPSCPSPLQCRRRGDRFACVDGQQGDVGGAGSDCMVEADIGCGEGLLCVPGALVPACETTNCCVPLCDLDAVDSCSAPSTCSAALGTAAPGFENIGACFVPA